MPKRTIDARKSQKDNGGEKQAQNLRSVEKREQILSGAMKVFLDHGFHGASIDGIAQAAGVSKPTIYNYFDSKEALFIAIIRNIADRILVPTKEAIPDSMTVEAALYRFAQNYGAVMLDPTMLAVHRLAMGEAQRFPKLGALYYEAGPEAALEGIKNYLSIFVKRKDLQIDNLIVAAHHFWGLTLNPQRTIMLFMPEKPLSKGQIDQGIKQGIKAFLAIYCREA